MVYPVFAVMVKVLFAPWLTETAPEGEIVPPVPAEARYGVGVGCEGCADRVSCSYIAKGIRADCPLRHSVYRNT